LEIILFTNFKVKRFLKFYLPIIIWAGIIFLLSSIPNLESGLEQDFLLRKIAHVLEYFILTFLLLRAFGNKSIILSIIIAVLYAFSDEYHQTFVFGRHGALKDVGINSIGILLMSFMWYIRNKGRIIRK